MQGSDIWDDRHASRWYYKQGWLNPKYQAIGNLPIIAPDEHHNIYISGAKSRFAGEENDMTGSDFSNKF